MSEMINRGFMYGESVFTTMRMINGHLCDWDYHFDRLKKSVDFVYGPFIEVQDWEPLFKNRLLERFDGESGDRVIRITIFLESAKGLVRSALISINDLKISFLISHYTPITTEDKMHQLRTCAGPVRPSWWPSFLKAGNYLETILSQKFSMKPGDDDVLFLSPGDTVLESSIANIFVVRHNILYTAPTGPNVLDGVMRTRVIEVAENYFDDFSETETTVGQLLKADAVFGTNSVRGPFLIAKIDDHQFNYSQNFLTSFEALRKRVMA